MEKKKILIIVDAQNDFCGKYGKLVCEGAEEAVDNICKLLQTEKFDAVYCTQDTHTESYEYTREGKMLPVSHCIVNSLGWTIHPKIGEYLRLYPLWRPVYKCDFMMHPEMAQEIVDTFPNHDVYICGFATDICVLNNALLLNRLGTISMGSNPVTVLKDCCAGTTKDMHEIALKLMKQNQINIV